MGRRALRSPPSSPSGTSPGPPRGLRQPARREGSPRRQARLVVLGFHTQCTAQCCGLVCFFDTWSTAPRIALDRETVSITHGRRDHQVSRYPSHRRAPSALQVQPPWPQPGASQRLGLPRRKARAGLDRLDYKPKGFWSTSGDRTGARSSTARQPFAFLQFCAVALVDRRITKLDATRHTGAPRARARRRTTSRVRRIPPAITSNRAPDAAAGLRSKPPASCAT